MKNILSLVMMLIFSGAAIAQEHAAADLDYGDHTSVTLQVKAWEALGEAKYADAVKYADKCAELYEEEARAMQASLESKPAKDVVNDYWALNDVGTTYYIKGEALSKMNRNAEALVAYKIVRDELYFSQAWDPKGWYWAPADAAKQKIRLLEIRAKDDF
jgi:tetratricopeptide (TPR) repeat protein